MLTFLDSWVYQFLDLNKEYATGLNGIETDKGIIFVDISAFSPIEYAFTYCFLVESLAHDGSSLAENKYTDKAFRESDFSGINQAVFAHCAMGFLKPSKYLLDNLFFTENAFKIPLRAVRLSHDLIRTFSDVRAPAEDLPDALYYFDVPHRAIMLEQHQVRALFYYPNSFLLVIFSNPGSSKYHGSILFDMDSGAVSKDKVQLPDAELVRNKLMNFVRLCVLYADSQQAEDYYEDIPQVSSQALNKLSGKKQRNKLNKASLFTIRTLKTPKGNFGRSINKGQWVLQQRITVRGHFKHQVCGKGRSQRKLIFISEYQKGLTGEREKPVLEDIK